MYNNLRKKFRQNGRLHRVLNKHIVVRESFVQVDKKWSSLYCTLILRNLYHHKVNFKINEEDYFNWDIVIKD